MIVATARKQRLHIEAHVEPPQGSDGLALRPDIGQDRNERQRRTVHSHQLRIASRMSMRADSLASSSTSLIDRGLPNRFAAEVAGRGEVCDMGCGPGHVARYLRDIGTTVFGLDFSPRMVEQARQLNPDISFRQGNMLALDIPDRTLAGIAPFYAIVNIPKESLPLVFREMERVKCSQNSDRCL